MCWPDTNHHIHFLVNIIFQNILNDDFHLPLTFSRQTSAQVPLVAIVEFLSSMVVDQVRHVCSAAGEVLPGFTLQKVPGLWGRHFLVERPHNACFWHIAAGHRCENGVDED